MNSSLERWSNPLGEEPQLRRSGIFGLLRKADAKTIRITLILVAIASLPPGLLSFLRGSATFKSFVLDPAAMSRFFLVIPTLILAWSPLVRQQELVARHFSSAKIVHGDDRFRFQKSFVFFQTWRDSRLVRLAIVVWIYAMILTAMPHIQPGTLLPWCYTINRSLSPAGLWYVFVSLPIVIFLALRWCWSQALWAVFLNKLAHMDLNLVSSHPDRAAGLMFVLPSLIANFPYAFVIGTMVAGGIANQVLRMHRSLFSFREVPLFAIAFVLLVCAGPLCVFLAVMRRARVRGTIDYGTAAMQLGRQFERKWLGTSTSQSKGALEAPDFSALTDLNSIVANVHNMRLVPLDFQGTMGLIFWVVAPMIPVFLAAVPLDVVIEKASKLFF